MNNREEFRRDILAISEVSENPDDPYKDGPPKLILRQVSSFKFDYRTAVGAMLLILDALTDMVEEKDQIDFQKAVKESLLIALENTEKYITRV
jgi:hypothetical protein